MAQAYEYINDASELVRRFNTYVFGPDVPAEAKERLQTIPGSDADKIATGREILYAHYDLLNKAGKILTAQLAGYAVGQNWVTENANGRSEKIRDKVRRDIGEPGDWLPKEDDPEPQTNRRDGGVNWKAKRDGTEPVTPTPATPATPAPSATPAPPNR